MKALTPAQCLLIKQAAQTLQALHESTESPEEEKKEHEEGGYEEDDDEEEEEDKPEPKKGTAKERFVKSRS